MKTEPLVSVITPMYKSKEFILTTINSVLNQSYQNWELILVDDASGDNIKEFIHENIKDERVKIYEMERNGGPAKTRNLALDHAKGRFIAFLDSDDEWDKSKLDKQIRFMLENDYAFSFTAYDIIDENNNIKTIEVPISIDYEGFLRDTIIGTSTVILDKSKINNVKLVDVRQDQDSVTWLRVMRENNIVAYGINESLTFYYKREGSVSHNKLKAARVHWRNLRKFERLGFLKTANVFIQYSFNAFKKHYF